MLLGIILLILLIVMSLVSSREVHDTLKETIVKASATQAIDNDATRLEMEDLRAKYCCEFLQVFGKENQSICRYALSDLLQLIFVAV